MHHGAHHFCLLSVVTKERDRPRASDAMSLQHLVRSVCEPAANYRDSNGSSLVQRIPIIYRIDIAPEPSRLVRPGYKNKPVHSAEY